MAAEYGRRRRDASVGCAALILALAACTPAADDDAGGAGTGFPDQTATTSPSAQPLDAPVAQRGPRPPPNPASLSLSVDDDAAVTQLVGPEGGVLTASLPGGLTATLTIPEGALLSEVEIVMTPIVAAEGDTVTSGGLAGVALEPDGLRFLRLVNLEVSGPGLGSDWVGFSARADGGDFHAVPARTSDDSVEVAANHFSGWGVINAQIVGLLSGHTPSSDESFWENELADADLTNASFNLVMEIFVDWSEDLQRRMGSASGEAAIEQLTGELVSLLDRLERRVVDDGQEVPNMSISRRVALGDLTSAWLDRVDAVLQGHLSRCAADGPVAGFRAYRWTAIIHGLADRSGLLDASTDFVSSYNDALAACLEYEIVWTVTVLHLNSTLDETWTGTAEARVDGVRVPPFSALATDFPLSGGSDSTELMPNHYHEQRQTSSIFPCTPVFGPGRLRVFLGIDAALPNLGDLATITIEGYVVRLEGLEPALIQCAESPTGRNLWPRFVDWIRLDNLANGRLSESAGGLSGTYEIALDASATPAASKGKLEVQWATDTTITGEAMTSVGQSIIVTHKP